MADSIVQGPGQTKLIALCELARIGMDEKLGLVTSVTLRQTFLGKKAFAHFAKREFGKGTACEIDCSMRELTAGAFEKALSILRKYRSQLEQGAKLLLEKADADA